MRGRGVTPRVLAEDLRRLRVHGLVGLVDEAPERRLVVPRGRAAKRA